MPRRSHRRSASRDREAARRAQERHELLRVLLSLRCFEEIYDEANDICDRYGIGVTLERPQDSSAA